MKLGFHGATTMPADLQTDIAATAHAGFTAPLILKLNLRRGENGWTVSNNRFHGGVLLREA